MKLRRSLFLVFIFCFSSALYSIPVKGQTILEFEEAKKRADSGDARAQAIVAMHFSLGWATPKDNDQAFQYASKSANAGDPLGLYRKGALLRSGDGATKNEDEGLKLQAKAARLWQTSHKEQISSGDPYSLLSYGIIFFQGKVVEGDQQQRYQAAASMYTRAAEAGFAPAQFNLAMCYIDGQGVEKNESLALRYLQQASTNDYPLAINWLQTNMPQSLNVNSSPNLASTTSNSQVIATNNTYTANFNNNITTIDSFSEIKSAISALESMINDKSERKKLESIALDTNIINPIDNQSHLHPLSRRAPSMKDLLNRDNIPIDEYYQLLINSFKDYKFTKISDLKKNESFPQIEKLIKSIPNPEKIQQELSNPDNQVLTIANKDAKVFGVIFANGFMIVEGRFGNSAAYFPSEILKNVNGISYTYSPRIATDIDGNEVDPNSSQVVASKPSRQKLTINYGNNVFTTLGTEHFPENDAISTSAKTPGKEYNLFVSDVLFFVKLIRYMEFLQNTMIVKNHIFPKKNIMASESSSQKLMGYSGLEIGMNQDNALSLIRATIDYTKYNALEIINCSSTEEFAKIKWKDDALEFIRDIQVATEGLMIAPPWTIAILKPKVFPDYPPTEPTDKLEIFVFIGEKLALCGRYPDPKRSNDLHPDIISGQFQIEGNQQFNGLIRKYGSPKVVNLITDGRSNNHIQVLWDIQDQRVGAIIHLNEAAYSQEEGGLTLTEQISGMPNRQIRRRGYLVPISMSNIKIDKVGKFPPSIHSIFYWTQDSGDEIAQQSKKVSQEIKQQQILLQESQINKTIDEL